MEDDFAIGIEASNDGISVVQVELETNATSLILGQMGLAIRTIGKVHKIEHVQQILVCTHVHIPIVHLLAVGPSQAVHLLQGSNEVQLHIRGHVRVQGDFQEDLFI